MATVKRAKLEALLFEDDAFMLAAAAAVRQAYQVMDDVPEWLDLGEDDWRTLIDAVQELVAGQFAGDVSTIRVTPEYGAQQRVVAIHITG